MVASKDDGQNSQGRGAEASSSSSGFLGSSVGSWMEEKLIEELVRKYAEPFVKDLHILVNMRAGEILIKDLQLKAGLFEQAEKFLESLGVDVWGTNGLPTIFPHGVEVEDAIIHEVRVTIPAPNPFNGDMWYVAIDGVEGKLRTLTQERRAALLKKSKAKAIEECERRIRRGAGGGDGAKNGMPVDEPLMPPVKEPRKVEEEEEDEDANLGYLEQLQKRIDKYFREHLNITIRNSHIELRPSEEQEVKEVLWDVHVGVFRLELGVGNIQLPEKLAAEIAAGPCSSRTTAPPGVKALHEKVGVGFEQVSIDIKSSPGATPAARLHFPGKAFHLHVVKAWWPEESTTTSNSVDRIHVDLADDFTVDVHWEPETIRAGLLRVLESILDGVACATPNFADWLTVPYPRGWTRKGTLAPQRGEHKHSLETDYADLLSWRQMIERTASSQRCSPGFFGFGCCTAQGVPLSDIQLNGHHRENLKRLDWFETAHDSEWIAGCRLAPTVHHAVGMLENITAPWEPNHERWLVTGFRRYEVTLAFQARFDVRISHGPERAEALKLHFSRNMSVVMVRDIPSEWHLAAILPHMEIQTNGVKWFQLGRTTAKLGWGRRSLLQQSVQKHIPEEVPSVCLIKDCSVGVVKITATPELTQAMLPLVAELPLAPLWPELRNFFGQWCYMRRPMGYLVQNLQVASISLKVCTNDNQEELAVSLGPLSLTTNHKAIYINSDWEPVWALDVKLHELLVSHRVMEIKRTAVSCSWLHFTWGRIPGTGKDKASCSTKIEVHPKHMVLTLSPDLLHCCVGIALAYTAQKLPALPKLVMNCTQLGIAFWQVAMPAALPGWLAPVSFSVSFKPDEPIVIAVNSQISPCFRITCSLDLLLTLSSRWGKAQPLLSLLLEPAEVSIEYLDERGSEQWEPLLEPWAFAISAELYAAPEIRATLNMKVPQGKTEPLYINFNSAVVAAARSLAVAWGGPVLSLLQGKKLPLRPWTVTALNLTGCSMSAQTRRVHRTHTSAALRLQAIFRGRKARQRLKEQGSSRKGSGDVATPKSDKWLRQPSPTSPSSGNREAKEAARVARSASATAHVTDSRWAAPPRSQMIFLHSGIPRSLPIGSPENERLLLNVQAIPRELVYDEERRGTMGTIGARDSMDAREERQQAAGLFGCLPTMLRRKRQSATSDPNVQKKLAAAQIGQNTIQPSMSSRSATSATSVRTDAQAGDTEAATQRVLLDFCRHGQLNALAASNSAREAAYICQVLTPSDTERMLLMSSTVRIFNYTDRSLDMSFYSSVTALSPLRVDRTAAGCACPAELLGEDQPLDTRCYGLPPGGESEGKVVGDSTMRVPANYLASVPVHLRTTRGVYLRLGFPTSDMPATMSDMIDVYNLPDGDVRYCDGFRIHLRKRLCEETTVALGAGRRYIQWDVCILPCFSVANAAPVPIDVQVSAGGEVEDYKIMPGKVQNLYNTLAANKAVGLRLRLSGLGNWSKLLRNVKKCTPRRHSQAPSDEGVVVDGDDRTACGELVVRHGDVCVVAAPVWLLDKSGLGLQCTDKAYLKFPQEGAMHLLDTTMKDNFLRLPGKGSVHLPQWHGIGADPLVLVADQPKKGGDLADRSSGEPRVFPLAVKSQYGEAVFGALHTPPVHALTIVPGLHIFSDIPLLLRQSGNPDDDVMQIPAGQATQVNLWMHEKENKVQIKPDNGSSSAVAWSACIPCSGMTGLYALAMHSGSEDEATVTLTVEISDREKGTTWIKVRGRPGIVLQNKSEAVESLVLVTDSSNSKLRHSSKSVIEKASGLFQKMRRGATSAMQEHSPSAGPDSHSETFHCESGQEVGAGWFAPFAKQSHDCHGQLFFKWRGSENFCGPLDLPLHRAETYIFLHPADTVGTGELMSTLTCGQMFGADVVTAVDVPEEDCPALKLTKGLCGSCGAVIDSEQLELSVVRGILACERCSTTLCSPSMRSAASQNVGQFFKDMANTRKKSSLKSIVKTALMCTIVNCSLQLPAVGISIVSKRRRQELLYLLVKGVKISFEAPDAIASTHEYKLEVASVRCDRQTRPSKPGQGPAILVSTNVNGADPQEPESSAMQAVPAVVFFIKRVGITSPVVYLKEVTCKLDRRFEANVDTDIANELFDLGDECVQALGPLSHLRLLQYRREELTPTAVLTRVAARARQELSEVRKPPPPPLMVQMDSCDVGGIHAKAWTSLDFSEMRFVPRFAVRTLQILTLSSTVQLKAAKISIHAVSLEQAKRASLLHLGTTMAMAYANQGLDIAKSVLKASNINIAPVAAIKKSAGWVATKVRKSQPKEGDEGTASQSEGLMHHSASMRSVASMEPSHAGAAHLRLPRLILHAGRLTCFDEKLADLCLRMDGLLSTRMLLKVYQLTETPSRTFLLIHCDSLEVVELKDEWKAPRISSWSWDQVVSLSVHPQDPEMLVLEVDAARPQEWRSPCLSYEDRWQLCRFASRMARVSNGSSPLTREAFLSNDEATFLQQP
eukprot:TRINITY_DN28504_c0_g1_i1.p1 TRINITY_DN28504_c0_g1~~TRINITY_DN28504_c0_g1_i1.p1  ORF type:complete len:2482 (+),score=562.87 TRINITY_DN28504_c0_g1_i1:140-7585(+)